jgi:hypothetical protein
MISFRPAVRENTPLIIGLAGPTKSGKTMSALRVAVGLANGGTIAMLNTEGARGKQYADRFVYRVHDLDSPYTIARYTEGVRGLAKEKPAVAIIDSMSPMHEGPGGFLMQHEAILDRIAGKDFKARERATFTAWVEPRREINEFIYALLELDCHTILCMKAKEKVKIRKGQEPEFYWGPIVTEGLDYETIFTLILPPHSRGVPDLAISDMREPFDTMVPENKPLDEELGQRLAEWAKGGASAASHAQSDGAANPGVGPGPQSGAGTGSLPPGMTWVDDACAMLPTMTGDDRKAYWQDVVVPRFNDATVKEKARLLTARGK